MSDSCLVVMYHYVRDGGNSAFPAIRALPPSTFERQLEWLQDRYCPIVLRQLEEAVAGGAPLPDRAALLTFDDGFVDHYETVFPALRARGLSGVFFLAQDACAPVPRVLGVHKTHFLLAKLGADALGRAVFDASAAGPSSAAAVRRADVFGADRWDHIDERSIKNLLHYELSFEDADRLLDTLFARYLGDETAFARELYLSRAMIAEMARGGMAFGYHTRSHRMLSRLDAAQQAADLRGGVPWIRSLTGQSTVSFCYPWGGPGTYTGDTVRILDEAGYSVAFNTVRRCVDLPSDGRFELPRFDTRDLPPYNHGVGGAVTVAGKGEA